MNPSVFNILEGLEWVVLGQAGPRPSFFESINLDLKVCVDRKGGCGE